MKWLNGLGQLVKRARIYVYLSIAVSLLAISILGSLVSLIRYADWGGAWADADEHGRSVIVGGEVYRYLHDQAPPESKALVYRQPETIYYGNKKVIRDVDPSLRNLYEIPPDDLDGAYNYLKSLAVDYVVVPYSLPPTFYKSSVASVTANSRYVEPLIYDEGFRLYRLRPEPVSVSCDAEPDLLSSPWSVWDGVGKPTQRRAVLSAGVGGDALLAANSIVWYAGHATRFTSGTLPPGSEDRSSEDVGYIEGGTVYHLAFIAEGIGLLNVQVVEFDRRGRLLVKELWDSVLSESKQKVQFQFRTAPDTRSIRLRLNTGGPKANGGSIRYSDFAFCRTKVQEKHVPIPKSASESKRILEPIDSGVTSNGKAQRQKPSDESLGLKLTICRLANDAAVEPCSHTWVEGAPFNEATYWRVPLSALNKPILIKDQELPPISSWAWRDALLDSGRLFLERNKDAAGRLPRSFLIDVVKWFLPEIPAPRKHRLRITGTGGHSLEVFMHWIDKKGRKRANKIGEFSFDAIRRHQHDIEFNVPMLASGHELILRVDRLPVFSDQNPDQPLVVDDLSIEQIGTQ